MNQSENIEKWFNDVITYFCNEQSHNKLMFSVMGRSTAVKLANKLRGAGFKCQLSNDYGEFSFVFITISKY